MLNLARKLSIELHIVQSLKEPIPESGNYDALILLGGFLNSAQEEVDSFFEDEKQFLMTWLELDKPCLGFCLGHQVLADTFQAKIGPNFMDSVGFIKGHLTHDGREHPLFKGIESTFPLFKWHSQSIQTPVPHNYILLATSSDCVVEAFSIKGRPHIIGLQCDNHAAHPDDVSEWLESNKNWLSTLSLEQTYGKELLSEAKSSLKANQEMFTKLIKNFISLTKNTKSVSS